MAIIQLSPPVAPSDGDNELPTPDNRIRGDIAELEELSLLWRTAPTMPSLLHKTDTSTGSETYRYRERLTTVPKRRRCTSLARPDIDQSWGPITLGLPGAYPQFEHAADQHPQSPFFQSITG